MSTRRRAARAPAKLPLPAEPAPTRAMELIGLTDDDRMVLWDTGEVRPVSAFETHPDGYIVGGHYVIDWRGHAITVHCGNTTGGGVLVMFMCGTRTLLMPRAEVEKMLLGKVIPDPVVEAEILAKLKELTKLAGRLHDTPARQRGRLPAPPEGGD